MITPLKDPDSVRFGLGTLGLVPLPAGSPASFTDVGYIKSCTATYSRELKDFESAGLLVKRLAFRDRFGLNATWAEVSITNLSKLIPSPGLTASSMQFGGSRTINRFGVRFESTPEVDDGPFITIDLFRATPSGEFSLAFSDEDFVQYPVEFSAELDVAKPTGQQYGRITIS